MKVTGYKLQFCIRETQPARDISAKKTETSSRHLFGGHSRSKDTEYATRSISIEDCLMHARELSKQVSKYKEAIQIGNAQEIEIKDIDASLFE